MSESGSPVASPAEVARLSGPRGLAARLGRSLRHLPLAATGAAARFAEDPARGMVALERAVPRLGRQPRRLSGEPDALARLDRAVAADRYADALAILSEIAADDPDRPSAELAVRRIGGDLVAVASANPTDARGRRARRAAREQAHALRSALPTWAARPHKPAKPGGLGDGTAGHPGEGDVLRESDRSAGLDAGPARILHVVTNSLPLTQAGSTIRTQRIVRAQRDAGWDARAVTRPGYPVLHGALAAANPEVVDGVPYHRILPAIMPTPSRTSTAYREGLERLVRSFRPHVLHAASDHVNARAALEAGRHHGVPVAYEVRSFHEDTWLARHPGAETSDTYRWMRERHTEVMLAADVVTTLGPAMREEIIARGVDPARVYVVPNAVTMDYLAPRDRDASRARIALPDSSPAETLWVGSVATVTEHEGFATLVEAVRILRAEGVDARVLLVGDGPALASLRALAAELDVPFEGPGRVPVGDVRDYYDSLDVFALPRVDVDLNRRVTALKPLEALARGIPVVGSALPAVAEVLPPGTPLVPAGDPDALAGTLRRLQDPAVRDREGDLGHAWVASCRTWPSVTKEYRTAYASLGVPTA